MKVDDRIANYEINKHLPQTSPNETGKVGERPLHDEQKVGAENGSDQDTVVHFSQASKEAQFVKQVISSEPDVRAEKVAELKEKIQTGKYEIDHDAVADKLVDRHLDETL